MTAEELTGAAPESARGALEEALARTMGAGDKLRVCVGGEFSAGKTTLLNTLLGRPLLPVAIEETTALPTIVEYSSEPFFRLEGEKESLELSEDGLDEAARKPPEWARFLHIGLPELWLDGVELIDIPGSGSVDPRKRHRAGDALSRADAVIYLFNSRGPGRDDLESLLYLTTLGKDVFLGVSHWDEIQNAVARGEKEPDLKAWENEIAEATGARRPLVPIDNRGRGAADALDFLGRATENLARTRKKRFRAEAEPILRDALAAAATRREVLAAESDSEKANLHSRLLAARGELLKLRERIIAERARENETLLKDFDDASDRIGERLAGELSSIEGSWREPEDRDAYLEKGEEKLRQALAEAAARAADLSQKYGALELPPLKTEGVVPSLAPPPVLDTTDFLDQGRYAHLSDALRSLAVEAEESAAAEARDVETKAEIDKLLSEIRDLNSRGDELRSTPLPKLETPPGTAGRQLGRLAGELADLALIVFAPPLIASKSASYAGKSARAIVVAHKALRSASKVKNGGSGVVDKLALLDRITLAYWGEKIGSFFDKPQAPRVDPEARRAREDELRRLEAGVQKKRLEILSLQRKLSGEDAERAKSEMERVRAELSEMERSAEKRRKDAEESAKVDYRRMLDYEQKKCSREWQNLFARQTAAMRDLLARLFRSWSETSVPEAFAEAERKVAAMSAELAAAPEERERRLAEIDAETAGLRAALDGLERL